MERSIVEQAAEWVTELKGASPEQRTTFGAWLTESPRHVEEFLLAAALDRELEGIDAGREFDVEALVAELTGSRDPPNVVSLESTRNTVTTAQVGTSRWRWTAAAAGVALTIAAGVWGWRTMASPTSTYATAIGEQRTFGLADGSVVYLNTDSKIAVRYSTNERLVQLLSGEALFKVAKNTARPFRVQAGDSVIQAVGTQFNVYRRPTGITVSVLEGRVTVARKDISPLTSSGSGAGLPTQGNREERLLAAGEEIVIRDTGEIAAQKLPDTAQTVAWQQRRLVFLDDSLADVAAEFNRYNRSPQVKVEGSAAATQISGVFDADNPQALLLFLRRQAGISVTQAGDEMVIRGKD